MRSPTCKKLLALFLAFVMSLTCAPEALAAEKSATAATMQLAKTEGTVEVSNGNGKKVTLLKNMRLRSGYRIATEEASYAWTNLDSTKLAKLDAVSEMSIRKSGKKLELLLDAGNLFFNVTEPLDEEESLNIRTSTMIVGIRGTSGWVKVIDQWTSEVYILEGTVTVSVTDPVTGDVETATVREGESATCVVYPKEHAGRKCEIIRQTVTASATPGFVQVELPSGDPMREPDPKARLEQDQEEVHKQLEEIKTKLEAQDHNVSTAPVWANPEADKPAASNGGSSSRPSGGNGGADVPTPPQPSGLMMPQTDNALNALLGQNSSISVQANPALDARGNTLIVDSGLTVPAGKTLTLRSGIDVDVLGGQTMQVDGTMTVGGNVTNSGHISVASPNTLRVQGSLTNRRSLSVSATGHVEVDGMFVQQGEVALTEGALVRARGFSLSVEIPDWKVSDEPDGTGYYVLVYSPEEPEIFTVTLDPGDGTGPIVLETGKDGKLPALPTPDEREGYTFDGWFAANGKPVTTDTVFTEDMEIHAQWTEKEPEPEPETFTVTLDPGDGMEPIVLETDKDGKLPALPTPDEREGFTFAGWFTADGKPVTTDTVFTENMEIHAQWTEKKPEPEIFTVTLDPGNGTEPIVLETDKDGKLPALPTPDEREGYTFEGWFTADGKLVTTDTVFTEDMEIHAQWTENEPEPETFTVTLDPGDGTEPIVLETNADGKLPALPMPADREGYTFKGWFTADGKPVTTDTVFTEDMEIHAQWTEKKPEPEPETFTVTLDPGDGTEPIVLETNADGKLPALPMPADREGFTFEGWFTTDGKPVTTDTVFTENMEIHAQWTEKKPEPEPETFTVTLDPGDGTELIVLETNADGTLPALPTPADREGYTFEGWFTADGKPVTTDTVFTENMEIHAQWTENVYTITFDATGGTVTPANAKTGAGRRLANLPEPVYKDHTFEGWYMEPDGNTKVTGETVFTQDTTIYAHWSIGASVYSVTFHANGGKFLATESSLESETAALNTKTDHKLASLPTPEREGYFFDGWHTAIDDTGEEITTDTVFMEPSDVYAHWATWRYEEASKTLTVMASAAEQDYGRVADIPWISVLSDAETVIVNGSPSKIGSFSFCGGTNLASIQIPEGVTSITSIGKNAFNGCQNLMNVTIPASVEEIGELAFGNCHSMTSLVIPDGVTSIGDMAFTQCSGLVSVTIPKNVTSIGRSMFSSCSGLAEVEIPEGVVSIGENAFTGCKALKSMTIPVSITSIGDGAFYNCTGLRDVYYAGTKTQWDALQKSIGTQNGPLASVNTTIHYGMVTIAFDANGGTVSPASVDIKASGTLTDMPTATRDGYAFDGWYTAADGGTEITAESGFAADSTIYAHWAETGYTITFDANGGSVTPASADTVDGKLPSLPKPTRTIRGSESMTFTGWFKDDGTTQIDEKTIFTAPCTVYAHWAVDWEYDEAAKTLKIVGDGLMSDYTESGVPWSAYRSDISTVDVEASVTKIGSYAFYNCTGLTNVTLRDNMSAFGTAAFRGCSNLTSITIPESVRTIGNAAFYGCEKLENVIIPNGVHMIAYQTFFGCNGLKSVTIPESVNTIGGEAFRDCSGLINVAIPDSVTAIGAYAFYGCSGLTSVTIPSSVFSIGISAFSGCSSLTSVTIPGRVSSIDHSAFQYCSDLTSVTIRDGVTSIGNFAFSDCSGLTSVAIPDSVTSIGDSAFRYCSSLKDVYYDSTEEAWRNITIDTSNDPLTSATIHCTDGNITPETQTASLLSNSAPGYTDVPADAWYAEAATYCREHNLMNGTSATTFSPDATLTRAMMVTVLHRLAGKPVATGTAAFPDVPANKWYEEAVSWASGGKIVLGYPDGSFNPDAPVTREQAALIFQRYSGDPSMEIAGEGEPKSPATRAEIAVTLMDYARSQDSDASAMDVMVSPSGIALDADGSLLVTDVYNKQIWRVRNRASEAYAGGQTVLNLYGQPLGGYNDAGLADSYFKEPWAIAPFLDGWAVSDAENDVVRLIRTNNVQTVNGATGEKLTVTEIGVAFNHPTGLASDDEGNLYVSDTFSGSIRKITPKGGVSTVARNLSEPTGLCWKDGVLYAAETGKDRIVKIQDGKVSAVASGFDAPQGVAVGDDGSVYVSDTGNDAVRAVKDGKVTTVAARDMASTEAGLTSPVGLLVQDGRLYVCDTFAKKIFVYQIG